MQLRRYTIVRLILEDEGRVLLLRQTNRNGGKYTLIGGKIQVRETPIQALIRETFEESGAVIAEEDLEFVGFAPAQRGSSGAAKNLLIVGNVVVIVSLALIPSPPEAKAIRLAVEAQMGSKNRLFEPFIDSGSVYASACLADKPSVPSPSFHLLPKLFFVIRSSS